MYIPDTREITDENGELEHYCEAMLNDRDKDIIWGFDYAVEEMFNYLYDSDFTAKFGNAEITVSTTPEDLLDFINDMEARRDDLIVGIIDGDEDHDKFYEERSKELKEIGIDAFKKKYCTKTYSERFKSLLPDNEDEE